MTTTREKTLHVIAGSSAGDSLKKMLVDQGLEAQHEVLIYWDDLSIGPLFPSASPEEIQHRIDYLRKVHYDDPVCDNDAYFEVLAQHIWDFRDFPFRDYETIVVWHSRTASEALLFHWMCHLCFDYDGNFEEVAVDAEAFRHLDYQILGLGYLCWQILATCYQDYRETVHPIKRKNCASWWQRPSDSLLRVGRSNAVPEDFFDSLILSLCKITDQAAMRIMGAMKSSLSFPLNDSFITYRLRILTEQKQLIAESLDNKLDGSDKSGENNAPSVPMLDYRVKLPAEIIRETVLHIVSGDGGGLRDALALKGLSDSQTIIGFRDDLSVGQLPHDFSPESLARRERWWQSERVCGNISEKSYTEVMLDFLNTRFSDFDQVIIWHGTTVNDQLLLFLMHDIYHGPLHQVTIGGKMYDGVGLTLGVLSPIQVAFLLEDITTISHEQAESYRQQWQYWRESSSMLRIMRDDDTVMAVPEDHFDDFILSHCTTEWQAAARVVGNCLGFCGQYIGDDFFTNRLRHLIAIGKVQAEGNTDVLRAFKVKR